MKSTLANFKSPAILSSILVLPFMILEWANRRSFNQGFPIPLFGILWLLPVLFILTVMPNLRNKRAGNGLMAHPVIFLIKTVFFGYPCMDVDKHTAGSNALFSGCAELRLI
jgi:hypothetical protein